MEIKKYLTGFELEKKLEYELKIFKNLNYFGFEWDKILYSDIAEITKFCINGNNKLGSIFDPWFGSVTKKNIIKYLISIFFKKLNDGFITIERKTLTKVVYVLIYNQRNDSVDNLRNLSKNKSVIWGNLKKGLFLSKYEFLSIKQIKRVIDFFKIYNKIKSSFLGNNIIRFYLALKVIEYKRFIEFFSKIENDFYEKSVVFSFDWRGYENVLCQIFKKNNCRTFALQHAVYPANTGEKAFLGNIVFHNFTADYLLSWGRYLEERLSNQLNIINKKHFLTVCHPCRNMYLEKSKWKMIAPKHIWILGSQKRLEESNLRMIEICKELSNMINFSIKLHPSCNIKKYKELLKNCENCETVIGSEKSVRDLCNGDTLFISGTTSAYYEVIACGFPCFHFEDEYLRDAPSLNMKFKTKNELLELLSYYENNKNEIYSKMELLTEYVMGSYTESPDQIYINSIESINC